MEIKYNLNIQQETIYLNLKRLINQIYKLLPMREEGKDWEKLLQTIIQELVGMKRLLQQQEDLFFLILCKLEGLHELKAQEDMLLFRRTIFKCLELVGGLEKNVCDR